MKRILATLSITLAITVAFAPAADAARRRSVAHQPPPFNLAHTEGGYADRTSVEQGGEIRFHIATSVSPFDVQIVNLAEPATVLRTERGLTSRAQNCSGRFTQGCDWDVTTTLDVPTFWPSGYYAATFPTALGEKKIIFVVRENDPGSRSSIVLISPTHTYQAYNSFGGRSLYPSNDPERATLVTYDRPYQEENGLGRFEGWEKHLVDWLELEGEQYEVITDADLENPSALLPYTVAVIAGHSEYWTASARDRVEQFVAGGGHLVVLSGNTMWWQIRLEDQNRTIAGYKGAPYDPAFDIGSPLASTHFFSAPVNDPENRLLGASFRNGGYTNRISTDVTTMKPVNERTPYTVVDGNHWVFSGTGLDDGDEFGRSVAGLEVDGVVFNCNAEGEVIGPDGSDESPLNYEILATLPAENGWGTIGLLVHPSGGAVFNAATMGWTWGLAGDNTIRQITRNVLNRFESGAALPYNPVQTSLYAEARFNCGEATAQAGWAAATPRPRVTQACAYEGSGGLELTGENVIAMARSLAPIGQSRNRAEVRFYLKADEAVQRTTFPMPLLTLRSRDGNSVRQIAHIELDTTNGKRIRLARRPAGGGFAASTEWLTLSDGWHLIEMSWSSPGTMTLQVDGGTAITLANPDTGQRVNEVVLQLPTAELSAEGRVCVDALAVGSEKPGAVMPLF